MRVEDGMRAEEMMPVWQKRGCGFRQCFLAVPWRLRGRFDSGSGEGREGEERRGGGRPGEERKREDASLAEERMRFQEVFPGSPVAVPW